MRSKHLNTCFIWPWKIWNSIYTWKKALYPMEAKSNYLSSWCDGLSDRSFMVDPVSYFSFQPVLHDWCNKGTGMCYPVCGVVHIKDPLLLITNNSPCSGDSRFLYLLYEWSFTICQIPYNCIKNCSVHHYIKHFFPSFPSINIILCNKIFTLFFVTLTMCLYSDIYYITI